MRYSLLFLFAFVASLGCGADEPAVAQTKPTKAQTKKAPPQDPAKAPGLKIGDKAPTFTLKDQTGKERSLEEFLKEDKITALVFYRSASW